MGGGYHWPSTALAPEEPNDAPDCAVGVCRAKCPPPVRRTSERRPNVSAHMEDSTRSQSGTDAESAATACRACGRSVFERSFHAGGLTAVTLVLDADVCQEELFVPSRQYRGWVDRAAVVGRRPHVCDVRLRELIAPAASEGWRASGHGREAHQIDEL